MSLPDPRLHLAGSLLQQRRWAEARGMLEAVLHDVPHDAEAARLLAAAQLGVGDVDGAQRVLREAIAQNSANAGLHAALGEVLLRVGDVRAGEDSLREALRLDSTQTAACLSLLRLLRTRGRAGEAIAWARLLVNLLPNVADAHAELGRTLAADGQFSEAVLAQRRATQIDANNPVMALQLGLSLIDADQHAEAEVLLRRLQQHGVDVPELWFGLARAALGLERREDAEAAFRQAIQRRPDYMAAHADFAQAVWTRTGDLGAASAEIDRVLRVLPQLSGLRATKAGLYRNAGEPGIAYAQLREALERFPDDAELLLGAADAALGLDAAASLKYANRAAELIPSESAVLWTLGNAQLANGLADETRITALRLLELNPEDQQALAMLSSAQRLLGVSREGELTAGPDIVRAWTIDTPPGWPDLPGFLRDLATSLRRLHTTRAHPLGQTLREGTQTNQDLMRSDDPVIRAFVQAIDGPIRRHMAALGQGDGPLRRRNSGAYRIQGMWSVQLRPHGFHVNHFHPEGWLSSACYIDLPPAVADEVTHAGWIKFGEPGIKTEPPLAPEYFVQPKPGLLVLFPSYLWHGTVPFAGEPNETRLTIAFDVVPA
jgi:tetratricopeptide (TPR) repeat protein